jgi:allantoicase
LRLTIFPDGGVARLRVLGEVVADEDVLQPGELLDLAAAEHGGFVVACSDMHYGHRQNLIMPGRSTHMGDGWETKRRRGPGHEWSVVRLAKRTAIERVELDTDHFRGNAPGSCTIECCDVAEGADVIVDAPAWRPLLPSTPLQPHARFRWQREIEPQTATHVRLNIFPDGGVARFRVFGRLASR